MTRPAQVHIFESTAPDLELTVLGRPQPAGSKRAFKHPRTSRIMVVDDAKGSAPWKQQVAGAAAAQMEGELLEGPLDLELVFVLARPRGHYGRGRNAQRLLPSAPPCPIVKPDTTKLVRCVEDALTGIVWRDDAQVVEQRATKEYGAPERCEIKVKRLR